MRFSHLCLLFCKKYQNMYFLLPNMQYVYIIGACKSSRTFVKNRKGESKLWVINCGSMQICNHCKAM